MDSSCEAATLISGSAPEDNHGRGQPGEEAASTEASSSKQDEQSRKVSTAPTPKHVVSSKRKLLAPEFPPKPTPFKDMQENIEAQAKEIAEAAARLTISHDDVLIAVMGMTGTGKSSFIRQLTGSDEVKVGHSLRSCTSKVDIHVYNYRNKRKIFLLDTPGFDDTDRKDTEILKAIAYYLGAAYSVKVKLAGVIYLHRITDIRYTGSATRNLRMFQALCGGSSMANVVLATTMWDSLKGNEDLMKARNVQAELEDPKCDWWYDMIQLGSKTFKHYGNVSTATDIIDYIMGLKNDAVLDIQRQMIDDHRTLDQTTAGQEMQKDLLKAKEEYQEAFDEAVEGMKIAVEEKNNKLAELYARKQDEYLKKIKASEEQVEQLRQDFTKIQKEKDEESKKMIAALKEESDKLEMEAATNRRNYDLVTKKYEQTELEIDNLRTQRETDKKNWEAWKEEREEAWLREQQKLMSEMERTNEELEKRKRNTTNLAALMGVLVIGTGLVTMNPVLMLAGAGIMGGGASAGGNNQAGGQAG